MAGRQSGVTSLLSQARDLEGGYNWHGAAEAYAGALGMIPKGDLAESGRVREAAARALFRWAMQAHSPEEFQSRLGESEREYRAAQEAYTQSVSAPRSPQASRCEAMLAWIGFWQASDVATKRGSVAQAWSSARATLDALRHELTREFGWTFNELFPTAAFVYHFSDNQSLRREVLGEALAYGEDALAALSDPKDRDELARAMVCVAGLHAAAGPALGLTAQEQDKEAQRTSERWSKALGLSEVTAFAGKAYAELLHELGHLGETIEGLERLSEKQLIVLEETGDRLAIGVSAASLAYWKTLRMPSVEDPVESAALLEHSRRLVEQARDEFLKLGFTTPDYSSVVWASSPTAPWYHQIRAQLETEPRKRTETATRALEAARAELTAATKSGYPLVAGASHLSTGKALLGLAKLTAEPGDRIALLEEAVQHLAECARLLDLLEPSSFWDRAVLRRYLGETELECAQIAPRAEGRTAALASSIAHLRECLGLFESQLGFTPDAPSLDALSGWMMSTVCRAYGRALRSDHETTGDRDALLESAAAFEKAAEFDGRTDMPSRVAESLWEAARAHDGLADYLKASQRFDEAARQYTKAAEKIGGLRELFLEQALYMHAWSEVEKARYHQSRQEPAAAMEEYAKAAEFHGSSKKWAFLSTNYRAWSQVENAEDLSQKGKNQESIDAFGDAARLFRDSRRMLLEWTKTESGSGEERRMVEGVVEATNARSEFCKGRAVLEEARLLDRNGDLTAAAEKYRQAGEVLARLAGRLSEPDRREINLIVMLSKAWETMARAEAESSPELYREAARHFDEAKDLSPGDKAKNLALGHGRLCLALAAGAMYADRADPALHQEATQNLESAARYYLKANQESAAEYAKASRLLFDGYAYMNKASREEDHEAKSRFYALAEQVLQASAAAYGMAEQPGRKQQVLRLLGKVKEDRELAASLAQVFLAPDIATTTVAFSAPGPTREAAVGLDRFAHAEVRGTLHVRPQELHVGQELTLDIEFVNAGQGAAQLTKVERVIPKGFAVADEGERYRIADHDIDLRGRRLDALESEEVRLVLKSGAKGTFKLSPRIVYIDESGATKMCEPTPVAVTVRELGISGWLKGR